MDDAVALWWERFMPAPDIAPAALASLTERELEILHLLTAGHTIKSIAAHLGRSEASINERLREARRKTGAGSSRELARLVEAQKICPRNPDLSARAPRVPDASGPSTKERRHRKGLIAMTLIATLAAAGLLATAAGDGLHPAAHHPAAPADNVASQHAMADPLVGRWALDTARIPADERPQRVTITFRLDTAHRWNTEVEIVGADGQLQRGVSNAAADGVPVPIAGSLPFIDTAALRQPEPGTLVMTLGKAGKTVSSRVYAASRDRRRMTETIIWGGPALPGLETTQFERID